jgi:hypothetical protein
LCRKDIGLAEPIMCRRTVQGRHLISDDNGTTHGPWPLSGLSCLLNSWSLIAFSPLIQHILCRLCMFCPFRRSMVSLLPKNRSTLFLSVSLLPTVAQISVKASHRTKWATL